MSLYLYIIFNNKTFKKTEWKSLSLVLTVMDRRDSSWSSSLYIVHAKRKGLDTNIPQLKPSIFVLNQKGVFVVKNS